MTRFTLAVRAFANILFRNELPVDITETLRLRKASAAALQLPSEERPWWMRLDPGIGVLLALPPVLAALNSSWIYYSPSFIDSWVYFGYFLYLKEFKASLFPHLYYGSRLPWILPGYWVHSLFGVLTANYILHFGFYYLAVLSFYSLLKRAVGQRNALLGAILFGSHTAFLFAIGWDYIDGAGLTYNLLGLACMARAASTRHQWLWLMLGGAAGAAMVYTNLFLLVFVPFVPLFFLFLRLKAPRQEIWRIFFIAGLWFAAGALALTVLLGAINQTLDGDFWFYAPSITIFRYLNARPNPWRAANLDWLRGAYWLGVPAMTAVASVLYAALGIRRHLVRWGDAPTFFVFLFLAESAGMIGWYCASGSGLHLFFYASYLLPAVFLAMCCMLAVPTERWRWWVYWPSALIITIAFVLSVRICESTLTDKLHQVGFAAVVTGGTVGLGTKVIWRQRWQALLVALCDLWLYQVGFAGIAGPSPGAPDAFLRVMDGEKRVWSHMHGSRVLFWYDLGEPAGPEFNAVNAIYLWGYSQISTRFPAIAPGATLQPGRTGVILSERPNALEQANQALRSRGLKAHGFEEDRISRSGVNYHMTFFRLEKDTTSLAKEIANVHTTP